jgi:hypothetical protein
MDRRKADAPFSDGPSPDGPSPDGPSPDREFSEFAAAAHGRLRNTASLRSMFESASRDELAVIGEGNLPW